LPFDVAPVQVAFILIGEKEELTNYYQEIASILTSAKFRCKVYNKNKQVNLNILQADKEGCPLKIILGTEELEKEEITLIRRDDIKRKITISLKESEIEKKYVLAFEKYIEEIKKIDNVNNEKIKSELEKQNPLHSFKKGTMAGKIFKVITKEVDEFKKNTYQKSTNFHDKHIFPANNFSELQEKINKEIKGLFLIPFCNFSDCERTIPHKLSSYSIRCLSLTKKLKEGKKCIFCAAPAVNYAYLGRSY